MIFITVGTELPFDRLVHAVDTWARESGRTDVFAQIGKSTRPPSFIRHAAFLTPAEFNERFACATTIIAHAGMGTILSALRYEKPILVMPRRAALGEHRNDHQLATVKRLLELEKLYVALDESELRERLKRLEELQARSGAGAYAGPTLISAIRDFIHRESPQPSRASVAPRPAADSANSPLGRLA